MPAYDELIYVAHAEEMDRDMIARFLRATERAAADIVNDPATSGEVFFASDAELRNELNTRAWEDTWPRFATRPAAVDHGRYDRFETFMQESGVVDAVIPAADLVVDVTAQAKP